MTYINPITGATVAAAPAQQAQLAADKARQVRREQAAARDAAATGDRFEPTVENAEAVSAVHDEQAKGQPRKRPKPRQRIDGQPDEEDGGGSHVDLRA